MGVEVLTWLSQKENLEPHCLRKIEEVNQVIQLTTKYPRGNAQYSLSEYSTWSEKWIGGPPQLNVIFASLLS